MIALLTWFACLMLAVCSFQIVAHGELPQAIERLALASFVIGALGTVVLPLVCRSIRDDRR